VFVDVLSYLELFVFQQPLFSGPAVQWPSRSFVSTGFLNSVINGMSWALREQWDCGLTTGMETLLSNECLPPSLRIVHEFTGQRSMDSVQWNLY
jgi:hypothetical protein